MRKEDLFREIGEIDEELIEEAAEAGSRRNSLGKDALAHKKNGMRKLMDIVPVVAACFVLIWIVSSQGLMSRKSNEAETVGAGTTAAAALTEADTLEEIQHEGAESWFKDENTEEGLETAAPNETAAPEATTAASAQDPVVSGSGQSTGEVDIFQKYGEFIRNGRIYSVTDQEFSEHELGERLDVITITGMDTSSNEEHEIYAEIWLINGLEEECAIAVHYEGDDRYFGAVNWEHCPNPWNDKGTIR